MREIRILRGVTGMCLGCSRDHGVIGRLLRHDQIKRGLRGGICRQ